jgi:hypothetical protein
LVVFKPYKNILVAQVFLQLAEDLTDLHLIHAAKIMERSEKFPCLDVKVLP